MLPGRRRKKPSELQPFLKSFFLCKLCFWFVNFLPIKKWYSVLQLMWIKQIFCKVGNKLFVVDILAGRREWNFYVKLPCFYLCRWSFLCFFFFFFFLMSSFFVSNILLSSLLLYQMFVSSMLDTCYLLTMYLQLPTICEFLHFQHPFVPVARTKHLCITQIENTWLAALGPLATNEGPFSL